MNTHAERVATFLEFACWDHHVHGKGDHAMHGHAARRLLAQHPEIARDSLYTAVVCGDRQEVERILAQRPEAAREPGGSRGWTPLLYLCYTRFPHQPAIDHAVTVARALLDRGANPNDFYMAGVVAEVGALLPPLVPLEFDGPYAATAVPRAEELRAPRVRWYAGIARGRVPLEPLGAVRTRVPASLDRLMACRRR